MFLIECNYMIYDKELLVIIWNFEIWWLKTADIFSENSVKIYTDHKNLKHFMMIKQLNCWQICWIKFLSEFNFKIMYWSDKQEKKSDIFIHWFQDLLKRFNDDWKKQQFQTLFQNHQLDENLKKTFNVIFYNQSDFSFSISNDLSEQDQSNEK